MDSLKLQLFTDASFDNLSNGESQAGQILFLTNNKKYMSFLLEFIQNKRVVRSTIAAETLSLSDGCDVCIYLNQLLSEILLEHGKTTQSYSIKHFYDAAHSMKQTLEKRLLVDITAIKEMVERNEINITWIEKEKQLGDILTKSGVVSYKILSDVLSYLKIIECLNSYCC